MRPKTAAIIAFFSNATTITSLVVMFGVVTSLVAWSTTRNSIQAIENERLYSRAQILEGALEERLSTYEEILRGGAALFKVNDNTVSREDWTTYVNALRINNRYAGLIAIGYAAHITADEKTSHENSVKAEGFPDYQIRPEGNRDTYTSIVYIEPFDSVNQRAFGYDMFSESTRRAAMERARDTGEPSLSDGLTLRQAAGGNPGFLFYLPVYSGDPTTVDDRRAQLLGYVYAPILSKDLFQGIIGDEMPTSSRFVVYDDAPYTQENTLFATQGKLDPAHLYAGELRIGSTAWHVKLSPDDALLTTSEQNGARTSLVGGIIATALIAVLVRYIFYSRARQIAYEQQSLIQAAKDELLSLASHQLRTPATGVKQYLGMVLQGYAGDITDQQRHMLQKAFTSNERQLEIVGQILHVTKLERGQLSLRMKHLDVTQMVTDVIDEQHEAATKKSQTIVFTPPKRHIYLTADPQYLRMAIENLLSNAIKYTHENGSITVYVRRNRSETTISIHDTGVGIDSSDFPKLFQKFSRIDNELSVQEGGSGIGLYLIKQIVELHSGYIEVESRKGRGSTFRIVIPHDQKH